MEYKIGDKFSTKNYGGVSGTILAIDGDMGLIKWDSNNKKIYCPNCWINLKTGKTPNPVSLAGIAHKAFYTK